jgi:hypothetical protein
MDGHQGDAGLNAPIGQGSQRSEASRGAWRKGLDFGSQGVIRRGHGEADAGVNLVDFCQRVDDAEHAVALGDDVDRKSELGDDLQNADVRS